MKTPKILLYDIETSPNVGLTWGKYEQTVLKFLARRQVLSISYAYAGSPTIYCETREGQESDKQLVTRLVKLINDADIVVAHNGDSFDNKVARTRALFHGLPTIKKLASVDTLRVARSQFMFDGNSLGDLAEFLGIGKKLPTSGLSLWEGCMRDDAASWREMRRYNKHDVRLLAGVYGRLRPWIDTHPNIAKLINPLKKTVSCINCDGLNIRKQGMRGAQQRWVCNACGKWFTAPPSAKLEVRP